MDGETGSVQVGKRADLVILDENPLENTKALYGPGAVKLNDATRQVDRVGGVRHTIKGIVVHDAKLRLSEVRAIVEEEKARRAAE